MIERVAEIVLGRRRKSAFRIDPDQRHPHAGAWPHIEKAVDVAGPQCSLGETPRKGGNRQRQTDNGRRHAARAATYAFAAAFNRMSGWVFRRHEFL
jgi:hypothetical protein